ncbi:MAG: hypothetical protein WKG07_16195 [Hymenobacter sp.]
MNGAATVQRYIDPSINAGLGYRHYSSPVQQHHAQRPGHAGLHPDFQPGLQQPRATSVRPFPNVFGYDETRVTNPATAPAAL